jgi:hypothetical protein
VDFLATLVRHLHQPLLIVWDRLPAHRSRVVQDFIAELQGWISTAYLPPYAPELNPVEYIWGYWKQHELPNVCPKDYWQLGQTARRTLRRMRRRPPLITAFWQQSSLWPRVTLYCARLSNNLCDRFRRIFLGRALPPLSHALFGASCIAGQVAREMSGTPMVLVWQFQANLD